MTPYRSGKPAPPVRAPGRVGRWLCRHGIHHWQLVQIDPQHAPPGALERLQLGQCPEECKRCGHTRWWDGPFWGDCNDSPVIRDESSRLT